MKNEIHTVDVGGSPHKTDPEHEHELEVDAHPEPDGDARPDCAVDRLDAGHSCDEGDLYEGQRTSGEKDSDLIAKLQNFEGLLLHPV